MMFVKNIITISFIFCAFFTQLSFAETDGGTVAHHCEGSKEPQSPCYPPDARLNADGSCSCPPDGCVECVTISKGLREYYCYYPVPINVYISHMEQ